VEPQDGAASVLLLSQQEAVVCVDEIATGAVAAGIRHGTCHKILPDDKFFLLFALPIVPYKNDVNSLLY
jgi:hypothetical protein